jgi:transcriptional regulator with XRE-family HTH domain
VDELRKRGSGMDINKRIDELRFQRGWSMYELAEEAGLTQSTLTSMMKRGTPPKIETLERICDAFGITLSQFFLHNEELEILNESEKKLVSLYRALSDRKRQALLELLDR